MTNASGSTASSAATLTVTAAAAPVITTQPKSVTVADNTPVSFKVVATGAVSYQWQMRKSSTSAWQNCTLAGYNTDTYGFTALTAHTGRQYRCIVTNSYGSANSNAATLTISDKPVISTQPKNASVVEDGTATFKVVASGATSYQWQYKAPGGSWKTATAEGNKTATLKVPATATRNGYQYRCVVTNANGSTTSSAATLTVKLRPVITSQPASQTKTSGSTVTFKVVAEGATTYQWQVSRDNGATWEDCTATGYDTDTYGFKATTGLSGRQYRCVLTNANGTTTSDAAILTVTA